MSGHLEELRERRRRLSLDAQRDRKSALELAAVEKQIAAAELANERATLAEEELRRREEEEAKRRADPRRIQTLAETRTTLGKMQALDIQIDGALQTLAETTAAYLALSSQLDGQLRVLRLSQAKDRIFAHESHSFRLKNRLKNAFGRAIFDAGSERRVFEVFRQFSPNGLRSVSSMVDSLGVRPEDLE